MINDRDAQAVKMFVNWLPLAALYYCASSDELMPLSLPSIPAGARLFAFKRCVRTTGKHEMDKKPIKISLVDAFRVLIFLLVDP
jgi:hypothetical protein